MNKNVSAINNSCGIIYSRQKINIMIEKLASLEKYKKHKVKLNKLSRKVVLKKYHEKTHNIILEICSSLLPYLDNRGMNQNTILILKINFHLFIIRLIIIQ